MFENYKIGVLLDAEMEDHTIRPYEDAFEFALDEAFELGLVDRPFEILRLTAFGPPWGSILKVQRGWQQLVDDGALCIFGPLNSESAIGLRDDIDGVGKVPTITWTGSDRWYGDYCFSINNGSIPEDPYLMANYLACQGIASVAVIYDRAATGYEYRDFFREACDFEGISITSEDSVGMADTNVGPILEKARASNAEALAYLGLGLPAVHMNKALAEMQWDPVRVMNTSFMTGPTLPEGLISLKGWIGCDQYDEDNAIGQDFLDRFEQKYDYRPENFMALLAYDTGAVIARAVSYASPMSPEGVKLGLEKIKMMPAAAGGANSVLSFAPHVRRAWLSPHFNIMREVDPDLGEGEEISLMSTCSTLLRHRLTPRPLSARRSS